ncbi:ATP-binding protein [Marinobacter sp. MDS2]|uniref:ATP-binding protein n=1 Tax=Marinobacter sp. MDS2 TaxID=3065961 RepID=UPI00352FF532
MSMRLTPHRFFAANPVGVDWVCGDLHGEFEALQAALSNAEFDTSVDRLFLLGDTIDRGPESRLLLEWVLGTDWVYSVMGNHELMFIAGAEDNRNRYKHRGMGGHWTAGLDETSYKNLAIQCRYQLPLTMTLECDNGQLGLVHAQSPFDDWRTVQETPFSERFAIDCTWPIDDIGYVKKTDAETQVLFEFIAHRYESGSLIVTANQPFSEWDQIFPDSMMTVAAVDRLIHHATIIELEGESYRRQQQLKQAGKSKK